MERLQKVIAHAGIASRRKAEELIKAGKVTVNGQVVTELGKAKVGPKDLIEVEGIKVEREQPVYFLLYKPESVVSTVNDDKNRKTVRDFFPEVEERIYPVGRLDYDTSGLLIMTNDGEFANLLMHPKYEIEKEYVAKVKGIPTKEQLKRLEKGIRFRRRYDSSSKGEDENPLIGRKKQPLWKLLFMRERNCQVRRMFEAIGCPVLKLKQEPYAFLTLQGLNAGEWRMLTPHEVKLLKQLAKTGSLR